MNKLLILSAGLVLASGTMSAFAETKTYYCPPPVDSFNTEVVYTWYEGTHWSARSLDGLPGDTQVTIDKSKGDRGFVFDHYKIYPYAPGWGFVLECYGTFVWNGKVHKVRVDSGNVAIGPSNTCTIDAAQKAMVCTVNAK